VEYVVFRASHEHQQHDEMPTAVINGEETVDGPAADTQVLVSLLLCSALSLIPSAVI